MFNPTDVIADTWNHLTTQLHTINMRLFWASAPECEPPFMLQLHQAQTSSPLVEEITFLCKAANEELRYDGDTVAEVMDAVQSVLEALCIPLVGSSNYQITPGFWQTPIGQVLSHAEAWAMHDDLIGYTEAAAILYPTEQLSQATASARVRRLVERGELRRYVDHSDPNPTHSARVSRRSVEQLAADTAAQS